jgi:hypothetical protein
MPVLVLAGAMMQVPQRALEILNLALVVDFLSLSQFQRLQHFLHLVEGMLQFIDDSVDLIDRVRDRGSTMLGFALARPFGLVPFVTFTMLMALFASFALVTFFPLFAILAFVTLRFLP